MFWASLIAQLVKNLPTMQETPVNSWVGKIHWRRDRILIPVFFSFLCCSVGKESPSMQEAWVQPLGWEDPLEKGYPLEYSGLENSMDYIVLGGPKESDTTE